MLRIFPPQILCKKETFMLPGGVFMFPSDAVAYFRGFTLHVRDSAGLHWSIQNHPHGHNPYIRPYPGKSVSLYSRPDSYRSYWKMLLNFGHRVTNITTQEGQWAWYTGYGEIKDQGASVKDTYVPARGHKKNMDAAVNSEFGEILKIGRAHV